MLHLQSTLIIYKPFFIMKTNKILLKSMILVSSLAFLASCGDDDTVSLPPIGGYNSADEVGAADLVAHWPLDGNGIESKSNTSPSNTVGATYEVGAKGQGLKLANGYLAYPEIAALSSTMPSMTISLWAKVTNNGGEGANGRPTMLFNLDRPNSWSGNINLMAETGWYASTNDTLVMKGLVNIKNGMDSNNQDVINSPKPNAADLADGHTGNANKNGGKWAHYVATWDAPTGKFVLYANGQKISNSKFEVRGGGAALPLNFFTPTKPIIGTFSTVVSGTPDAWQTPAQANIDEIRVYKKALVASDVKALYDLEAAGR
jgi:hypothetical protein